MCGLVKYRDLGGDDGRCRVKIDAEWKVMNKGATIGRGHMVGWKGRT